jgi:hypothetical protein
MVFSCEFDRQLCLAYATKTMDDDNPSPLFHGWLVEKKPLYLFHLCSTLNEVIHYRYTAKAELDLVLAAICRNRYTVFSDNDWVFNYTEIEQIKEQETH